MRFSIAAALLAPLALAQSSAPFTDPATGIAYQAFSHENGFKFGVAMPKTVGGDFIGLLSAPKSVGWAGGDLGPSMVGKLLIVAWPNGDSVVSSLRKATRKSNPPEFAAGGNITAIPKGTFVKADHWQLTFLCKGCLNDAATSFSKTAATDNLAYAFSNSGPSAKANKASGLSYHMAGFGAFDMNLGAAKSDSYANWAKLAG